VADVLDMRGSWHFGSNKCVKNFKKNKEKLEYESFPNIKKK